ncbi:MAG TPA: N-acetyl-1-D-myo-inositol-2-amino-2-deoxy-alpha-D-glucopyranoside deacetylase, partial [Thermoleophilia bacterium]|nr:N-acetyl-1-D-myo-inositol-2-amino-2-deoxy-alpha-D-glucopyranoside deacetylase [Thermoleophilia bacterium]
MTSGATPVTSPARAILFVHAHPDDETINNGATMAKYAAEGAHVTLVTCTLGEEGEVLVPELADLASNRQDRLGPHRAGELADAMKELGVTDHRFLGGHGHYRDSGMMGTPQNDRADAFWQADVDEAAGMLAGVIREVRPQVLVTYNEFGGYGHPDHIQAHRVAMRAVELAAQDGDVSEERPHQVSKVYWNTMPRSVLQKGIEAMRAAGNA